MILILDGHFLLQSLNFNNLGKFHMKGSCYYHDMRNRLIIMGFFSFWIYFVIVFYGLECDVRVKEF